MLVKLEFANPTGSMKDRMARTAIEGALRDGRLQPGDTVVEYTAGTTGISLAFVCAALGFPLHIVFSDAFSDEKRRTMAAFGAVVEDVARGGGDITESLIKAMIARAEEVSSQPGHWWCDQLNNRDAIDGYVPMGEEIWTQTSGDVDAFVHAVGTAHSIHGVARALRQHRADVRVVAVEPAESPVLSGGQSGANRIEGIRVRATALGTRRGRRDRGRARRRGVRDGTTTRPRGGSIRRRLIGRQRRGRAPCRRRTRPKRHGRHHPVRFRLEVPLHRRPPRSLTLGPPSGVRSLKGLALSAASRVASRPMSGVLMSRRIRLVDLLGLVNVLEKQLRTVSLARARRDVGADRTDVDIAERVRPERGEPLRVSAVKHQPEPRRCDLTHVVSPYWVMFALRNTRAHARWAMKA